MVGMYKFFVPYAKQDSGVSQMNSLFDAQTIPASSLPLDSETLKLVKMENNLIYI